MHVLVYIPWIVVASSALVASFTDVRYFKVHNRLTFPLLVSGLAFHTIVAGWSGLQMSMAGGLAGLGIMLVPYVLGAMGAGDVKFVAAVGAWLGLAPMLVSLVIGCLATGVYSIVMLARQGRLRDIGPHLWLAARRLSLMGRHLLAEDELEPVRTTVQRDNRRERLIPFSAMVSIGVFVMLLFALGLLEINGGGH